MTDPGRAGGSEPPPDGVDPDGPLRELRSMMDLMPFHEIAERVADKYARLATNILPIFTDAQARLYASAIAAKNWSEADALYLEELRRQDPFVFRTTLEAEGWAKAFNALLDEKLGRICALWRYMSVEELASFAGGTFESRVEADGGRRGYKAFSVHASRYFAERPAIVEVPIDAGVRRAVRPAGYTALPRPSSPDQERMGDKKYVVHAGETECRLPDGTRVPSGTRVLVDCAKLSPGVDVNRLRKACDSLSVDVYFT